MGVTKLDSLRRRGASMIRVGSKKLSPGNGSRRRTYDGRHEGGGIESGGNAGN